MASHEISLAKPATNAEPMTDKNKEAWDLVISSKPPFFDLRLDELWRYRFLIAMFVRRDFVAAYKQTILGPLWFIIPPILSSVTFTIIFGKIAQISTDGVPQFLFYMSSVVMWGHFNATVAGNSNIFTAQSNLFSKVYFPRLVIPVTNFMSGLLQLAVQFGLLAGFLAYYLAVDPTVQPQWTLLLLPVFILISGLLGLSVGIIASALTTRYRDLAFLVAFGMSLWMYATPVIYPLSAVPASYQWILLLNPMTSVLAGFRHAVLGAGSTPYGGLLYSLIFALAAFAIAVVVFNRIERYAMDTV